MNVNEDKIVVFRGHIDECLRHLAASINERASKGSWGAGQAKEPAANFCAVTVSTVARWLNKTTLPIGEQLIKMMCYFDLIGYKVIEFERLPRVRRNFAELIGFGLLSSQEASQLLGYTSVSTLYQVLQGTQGASESKDQKMWDVWKERKQDLQRKKEQAQEIYRLDIPLRVRPKTTIQQEDVGTSPCVQTAVVNIMEGLTSLLEGDSFKNPSEKDLNILKQSAGTILRLSARLSTLSSMVITPNGQKKRETPDG